MAILWGYWEARWPLARLAYELFAAPGSLRTRLKSLLPIVTIGVFYMMLYRGLGYGTAGTDLYLHPTMHFVEYAAGLVTKIPILLGDLLMGVLADLSLGVPTAQPFQVIVGLIGFTIAAYLSHVSNMRRPTREQRVMRFLGGGALLSLVPAAATLPQNRLLLCAAFGAAAIVAMLLCDAWTAFNNVAQVPKLQRRILLTFSCWLVVAHVAIAPALQLLLQGVWNRQEEIGSTAIMKIAASDHLAGRDAIILSGPMDPRLIGFYTYALWNYHNIPAPRSWKVLSLAPTDFRITRVGSHALLLELVDGQMLDNWLERIFRSKEMCLKNNDVIDAGVFTAIVEECNELGPTKVRFEFVAALDDESLLFLSWQDGEFRPQTLPRIGESLTLSSVGPL